jgi:hypothetical protein
MATTIPSAALVPIRPVFTNAERLALAGFLAGYSGLTRQAYELDLRKYAAWCHQHQVGLFAARRADIECFARDLRPAAGLAPPSAVGCARSPGSTATQSRRSSSITPRPLMSVGPGSITSPMRPAWTATSWVPCSWRPGSARPPSMR